MEKGIIQLTIEKLAGLGDGMGIYGGRKMFVPYTLQGDTVKAQLMRKTSDADYASLLEIITPSQERGMPVCQHFGACGGCALQHLRAAHYQQFKFDMARAAVRKAGYDTNVVEPIIMLPAGTRRRAELKIENEKLGYYTEGSHMLIDIEECPVLEPDLLRVILHLKPYLLKLSGIVSMQINGVDGGYDLLLEGVMNQTWQLPTNPQIVRVSARTKKRYVTLYQTSPVTVTVSGIGVEVPPGAFLQATLAAQNHMVAHIAQATKGAKSVLDLFSGIGTYSFALAKSAQVTAVENDTAMSDAVQKAVKQLNLPVKSIIRDLFQRPFTRKDLAPFDTVVINPPRAGAQAQCTELAKAKIPKVIMISCNPATFARDARLLREGGYALSRLTPLDQFVYSPHLELVAEFHQ